MNTLVNYCGNFNPTFSRVVLWLNSTVFMLATMGQGFKTFYHGNLPPFYGNYCGNIVILHRMTAIQWNGSKLLR
jgi:hypothetical protein